MKRAVRVAFVLTACASPFTSSAAAQDLRPVSVEATIGRGLGENNGEYRDNSNGLTGDLLVGYRLRSALSGALVAAAALGMQGAGSSTLECISLPTGECTPSFPSFSMFAFLGGWENSAANIRFLTGPAYLDSRDFAWQARIDLAKHLFSHLSLVIAGRAVLIPSYDGDTFQLLSGGIGLRLR